MAAANNIACQDRSSAIDERLRSLLGGEPDGQAVVADLERALADMDLDIRHAKVSTIGHEVVDAFYVVDRDGAKVADAAYLAEIEAGILAELSRTR